MFKHGSILSGKTRLKRVSSQWHSTAGDLVMSGFQVSLITQGADIILDIDELDTRLLDIQMPQASFEALQRPRGEVGWMLLE
jgi:hypothetical protein